MKRPTLQQLFFIALMIPALDWIFLYFSPTLVNTPWLRFGSIVILLLFLWVPIGGERKKS
jgi:hypothetical protein